MSLDEIKHFMIGANLYSLQALVLDQLLAYSGEEKEARERMRVIDSDINSLYISRAPSDPERAIRVMEHLINMWNIRENIVRRYFSRHPDSVQSLNEVFSTLTPGIIGHVGDDQVAFPSNMSREHFEPVTGDNASSCSCCTAG